MKLKTTFNLLLILILLAFALFLTYLGWEQRELDERSYGVVYTKTGGWKSDIYSTDSFGWSFEKLIPENYKMHIFTINSNNYSYSHSEKLPSAELYANFSSINSSDFNYSYTLTASYSFNPNYLVSMTEDGSITEENFTLWLQDRTNEIQNILKSYIRERVVNSELITIEGACHTYISEQYPYLGFSDIKINMQKPDMVLYNRARNRYLQNMEIETSAEEEYLLESLRQQNSENHKLELLKKYGEVFTQYPIMIEYLKIDRDLSLDRATFEDLLPNN